MSKRGPLTPEERQKYIDDGGGSCPYCGDGDYYGDSFECESSTVWQNLTCLACHRTWQDVYKRASVMPAQAPARPGMLQASAP